MVQFWPFVINGPIVFFVIGTAGVLFACALLYGVKPTLKWTLSIVGCFALLIVLLLWLIVSPHSLFVVIVGAAIYSFWSKYLRPILIKAAQPAGEPATTIKQDNREAASGGAEPP